MQDQSGLCRMLGPPASATSWAPDVVSSHTLSLSAQKSCGEFIFLAGNKHFLLLLARLGWLLSAGGHGPRQSGCAEWLPLVGICPKHFRCGRKTWESEGAAGEKQNKE